MGTSNSGRFASSSGIFLGLDPGNKDQNVKRREARKKDAGGRGCVTTCSMSDQRFLVKGNRDGIKSTYNLMPVR